MAYVSYLLPLTAAAGTIYLNKGFDVTKDVVVSFDCACYGGNSTGDEGFCVFFIDSSIPSVINGGPGPGLGYTGVTTVSAQLSSIGIIANFSGVSGAVVGVGFDLTGNFATSGSGLSGYASPIPNSISIRDSASNNYNLLYNSGSLSASISLYQQITGSEDITYNRIRVRITDLGKRIAVDIRKPSDLSFANYINYTLTVPITATGVKGCLSFANGQGDTLFKVKNFNINGFLLPGS